MAELIGKVMVQVETQEVLPEKLSVKCGDLTIDWNGPRTCVLTIDGKKVEKLTDIDLAIHLHDAPRVTIKRLIQPVKGGAVDATS